MWIKDLIEILKLPKLKINLMYERTTENDPFFAEIVKRFYKEACSRHPKLLFTRKYQMGFALLTLPKTFDEYFMNLDSSARNNYRKALRKGYEFKRIEYNAHLEEIRSIWMSCTVRQGVLPKRIREGWVEPIQDPPSRSHWHDYPYFGVFHNGQLVGYTGSFIAGEMCSITDLFGHANHLEFGVLPLLIIELARQLYTHHPGVKHYAYGTYFGAGESLRRFKRKFEFYPHRVSWELQGPTDVVLQRSPVEPCVS